MMNSKGLLATQGERHATLSVSFGRPKWDEGYLLIPRGLSAKLRKTTGEGLLNLKDLLKMFPSSSRVTFLRFVGRPKRDDVKLLIQQWLMANRVGKTSKGLLNLKELLTVFCRAVERSIRVLSDD